MAERSVEQRNANFQKNLEKYLARLEKHPLNQSNDAKGVKATLHRIGKVMQAQIRIEIQGRKLIENSALINSIQYEVDDSSVTFGSFGIRYAAIHEFGGTIIPKTKKYLTIPVGEYKGRRAREFNLKFIRNRKGQYLIDESKDQLAFILVKQVKIPKRPYLMPALDKQRQKIQDMLTSLLTGK